MLNYLIKRFEENSDVGENLEELIEELDWLSIHEIVKEELISFSMEGKLLNYGNQKEINILNSNKLERFYEKMKIKDLERYSEENEIPLGFIGMLKEDEGKVKSYIQVYGSKSIGLEFSILNDQSLMRIKEALGERDPPKYWV